MTVAEILENQTILTELKQAWIDSEPGFSGGHEEGGFIVSDVFGFLSVIRWEKGTHNEIILPPHKNCFVNGCEIVASFHTYPNTGENFQQEPSLTDIRAVRDDFDLKGELLSWRIRHFRRKYLFDKPVGTSERHRKND